MINWKERIDKLKGKKLKRKKKEAKKIPLIDNPPKPGGVYAGYQVYGDMNNVYCGRASAKLIDYHNMPLDLYAGYFVLHTWATVENCILTWRTGNNVTINFWVEGYYKYTFTGGTIYDDIEIGIRCNHSSGSRAYNTVTMYCENKTTGEYTERTYSMTQTYNIQAVDAALEMEDDRTPNGLPKTMGDYVALDMNLNVAYLPTIFKWQEWPIPDGCNCHEENYKQAGYAVDNVQWKTKGTPPEKPDLTITDIWTVGDKIHYKIKNIGSAIAGASHTSLTIDDVYQTTIAEPSLGIGVEREGIFSAYSWQCSGASDKIKVYADCNGEIDEANENNNYMEKTFVCGGGPGIETLRPNGVGVSTGFTGQYPAAGAHWDKVDDVTPDEGTYVCTTTEKTDLYALQNHSGSGTINSVTVYVRAKENNVSADGRLWLALRTHGTNYFGSQNNLTTSWVNYSWVLTTNPNTGLPWTWAEIDALQAGMKGKEYWGMYNVVVTQVYVEVDSTSFITVPLVITASATAVEETAATGNGTVISAGGENPARYIQWGTTTSYGSSCSAGVGGAGPFGCGITNLSPGTLYHFRAYATNSAGTGYGSDVTFTTKPNPPTGLSTTAQSQTQIDVLWTKGSGAEKTMVRRKVGSYPTSVSNGDQAYFDTGSSFSDTSLNCGTHYYYRAWSYKAGAPNSGYSDDYSQDDASTNACKAKSYGYIF